MQNGAITVPMFVLTSRVRTNVSVPKDSLTPVVAEAQTAEPKVQTRFALDF